MAFARVVKVAPSGADDEHLDGKAAIDAASQKLHESALLEHIYRRACPQ